MFASMYTLHLTCHFDAVFFSISILDGCLAVAIKTILMHSQNICGSGRVSIVMHLIVQFGNSCGRI